MGQEITVTVRRGASPAVRFLDCDRSLTGMAIERYASAEEARARGHRPPDVLAQRLFALGATKVTIYSNVVTLEAEPARWPELETRAVAVTEHLFRYYGEDAGWSPEALSVT